MLSEVVTSNDKQPVEYRISHEYVSIHCAIDIFDHDPAVHYRAVSIFCMLLSEKFSIKVFSLLK
jgi:hypothetical protein